MAQEERLVTLKNISTAPVSVTWDAVVYTFEPGEEKILAYGVGLHMRDSRATDLQIVHESRGVAPEVVRVEVQLVNQGPDSVTAGWDGRMYTFEPGKPLAVEQSIAYALMANVRSVIQRDKLKATIELFTPAPEAEAPPEPGVKKPRKPRTKKATTEEPDA